jgi:hypothetical protein
MTAVDAASGYRHGPSAPVKSSLELRVRVYFTRARLDRQLASEQACECSGALALRARQLTDVGTRRGLARGLRGTVDYVDRHRSGGVVTTVMIDRSAVREARELILGLAERLEGPAPVNPRGVALTRLLLTEGVSPLYSTAEQTVAQAIWEIQDGLDAFYVRRTAVTSA